MCPKSVLPPSTCQHCSFSPTTCPKISLFLQTLMSSSQPHPYDPLNTHHCHQCCSTSTHPPSTAHTHPTSMHPANNYCIAQQGDAIR
jgi:hypothetical protein